MNITKNIPPRPRKSCRLRNKKSENDLRQEAWRLFREGQKECRYEQKKKHFEKCKKVCLQLNQQGDISVCNWILGGIAFEKQFYSKARQLCWKAISMYRLARTFEWHQPCLAQIYAQYSSAVVAASQQRQRHHQVQNIMMDHPTAHLQKCTITTNTVSHIQWPDGIPCSDPFHTHPGMFLCHSAQMEIKLEDPVEEEGYVKHGCHNINDEHCTVFGANMENWEPPSFVKPFVLNCGDK